MSSKAYRTTRVNEVNWEQLARGKEGLGVTRARSQNGFMRQYA